MDSPIDDRDAGVCVTRAGSLLVTTFTSLAYQPVLDKAKDWPADRLARWQAVDRRTTAAQRQTLLGTWMLRSTDGGMTWSAPYRVPLNSPHGPVAMSDGRLLYAGKSSGIRARKWVCASPRMMGNPGAGWRIFRRVPAIAWRTITSCTRYKRRTAGCLYTFGITMPPIAARRCNANPWTAGSRGVCRIPSACGACRRICCGCAMGGC